VHQIGFFGMELNRRFDSANYPVRDLDGFKPRRSKTFVLCRQASFARCTHSRLSRPSRRTELIVQLIGPTLANLSAVGAAKFCAKRASSRGCPRLTQIGGTFSCTVSTKA